MIKSILKDRLINLKNSFMIGDKTSDFKMCYQKWY